MKRKIATLHEDGFCFTVGEFPAGFPLQENQLDVTDAPDVLGKYYLDGAWIEPAPAEPQPTAEEMLADIALNLEYSICLAETNMGLA